MATANDIIARALKLLGVGADGEPISASDAVDGLVALNALLDSLPANGVGSPLTPINVSEGHDSSGNEALFVASGGVRITLPEMPIDGMRVQVVDVGGAFGVAPVTLERNGRLLEGAANNATLSDVGLNRTWLYRADLGDWRRIGSLTATAQIPYPSRFDEAIAAQLAAKLAPTYSVPVTGDLAEMIASGRQAMAAAYTQLGAPASLDNGLRLMFSTRSRRLF